MLYNKLKNNIFSLFAVESLQPSSLDELQSKTITWLRFPLVLLVLLIHINPSTKDIFTPIQTIDISHLTIANIYSIIGRLGYYFSQVAVPFFFFTSGYFFFYKVNKLDAPCYKKKITKRIKTLVVPYLLWNLMTLFFMILSKGMGVCLLHKSQAGLMEYISQLDWNVLWNSSIWNEDSVNLFGWSTQMSGPVLLPLWFLRDLIVISFILTPLIYLGIKYLRGYWVLLLGIAYLLKACTLPGIGITGVFFFSFGAYLSLNQKNIVTYFRKNRYFYWIISIVCLVVCVAFDSSQTARLSQSIYSITAVGSVISIVAGLLYNRHLKVRPQLSQTSFFVYALHTMILLHFSCLGLAVALTEKMFFAEHYIVGYILSYFVSPFLGAGLCLVAFIVLKTYMPRLLILLTGGRN